MNSIPVFFESWLLGGMTYPALTFVITAAMKSTAIVLFAWSITSFLRRKPALMRLWLWRACTMTLLSVLLWAVGCGTPFFGELAGELGAGSLAEDDADGSAGAAA